MFNMDNIAEQCEEIEALKSIYGDQFTVEPERNSYSIEINPQVKLFITLNESYPSDAPPNFDLLAPIWNATQKKHLKEEFQDIYEKSFGGPVLFQWIEKLKEVAEKQCGDDNCNKSNSNEKTSNDIEIAEEAIPRKILSGVTHGEIIVDRKSVFQGHACIVTSIEDTKDFLKYLLENKKIAQATHNISAYRIISPKNTILQDCDDDGEHHAGGRVLHLLQILDLTNVIVVVSRWYGGIQLGPDRFKHINNAARQVLAQGGFLSS